MAEVLGAVAASLQLLNIVRKALEFYHELDDASNSAKRTRSMIDGLDATLRLVQECSTSFLPTAALRAENIVQAILSELQTIQTLIPPDEKLNNVLRKARWLREKTVVNKGFLEIERLKSELHLLLDASSM